MKLKEINSLGQKINKVTKKISDVNAVNEALNGNFTPGKRKIRNKVKNAAWKGLKMRL